ncbi:43083_t:CDS:2, partial [Gigaspora margarita]
TAPRHQPSGDKSTITKKETYNESTAYDEGTKYATTLSEGQATAPTYDESKQRHLSIRRFHADIQRLQMT